MAWLGESGCGKGYRSSWLDSFGLAAEQNFKARSGFLDCDVFRRGDLEDFSGFEVSWAEIRDGFVYGAGAIDTSGHALGAGSVTEAAFLHLGLSSGTLHLFLV